MDFDREYLWNGSRNRQAVNGVINSTKIFSTFDKINLVNFGPRDMFMLNFIELSAAVHELSCIQRKNSDENKGGP